MYLWLSFPLLFAFGEEITQIRAAGYTSEWIVNEKSK